MNPTYFIDYLNKIRVEISLAGMEILDFSMINPDLKPDRLLLDRLVEASLNERNHRYAVSKGIKKLRDGFSLKYASRFGVAVDPNTEICVSMGTKDALFNLLLCYFKPGDKALVGTPLYPVYRYALSIAGLDYFCFPVGFSEKDMLARITSILERQSIKLILLNFPSNPGGVTVSKSFYQELLNITEQYGCIVINDFTYGELIFDDSVSPVSLLSVEGAKERSMELYSMSKAYSIPGWRVGALLGMQLGVKRLAEFKSKVDYGIFLPIQIACAAALSSSKDIPKSAREVYAKRARLLMDGLERLGWEGVCPSSGASVWVKIPDRYRQWCDELRGSFSAGFAAKLLKEVGISLTPGVVFGKEYDDHVRFALVAGEEKIKEALSLLKEISVV